MTDVFMRFWASSEMRLAMGWAVLERLVLLPGARVKIVTTDRSMGLWVGVMSRLARRVESVSLPSHKFWIESRQYAENAAESDQYVVIDDDHLPIGKDWLERGVGTLNAYPEFAMLSSWSTNLEVLEPGPPLAIEVRKQLVRGTGASADAFPFVDDDVFEHPSSIGTPYFARRGVLGKLPDGELGNYDHVLSEHARQKGRIGFMRKVRHNHLGAHYSQVIPGHWGA